MDEQLEILTRQIGKLTAEIGDAKIDTHEIRRLIEEIRHASVEQSGALAVVAAEALSNRRETEVLKKKATITKGESNAWKQRFEKIQNGMKEIGQEKRLLSKKWTQAS